MAPCSSVSFVDFKKAFVCGTKGIEIYSVMKSSAINLHKSKGKTNYTCQSENSLGILASDLSYGYNHAGNEWRNGGKFFCSFLLVLQAFWVWGEGYTVGYNSVEF